MIFLENETGNMPIYKQLRDLLLGEIASGELHPGDRIYTESKLANRFQVSRTTIRRALGGLEREGLIVRFPGKGTFINRTTESNALRERVSVGINFFADFSNSSYYGELTEGILNEAEKSNLSIRVVSPQELEGQMPGDISGFLFTGKLNPSTEIYRRISKGILPAVGFNSQVSRSVSFIGVDNYEESRRGVKYLIGSGHRKIGFYGNRPSTDASRDRYRGYLDTLRENGLPPEERNVHFMDLSRDHYRQGIEYLRGADVDAVFVALAPIFNSLLYAMNTLHRSTADELQLLCFDNLEPYHLDWPGIAYIKMPLRQIGERMVAALRQQLILKEQAPVVHEIFKAQILKREA